MSEKISQTQFDKMWQEILLLYPGIKSLKDHEFVKDEIKYKRDAARKAKDLLGENEFSKLLKRESYTEILDRAKKVCHSTNLLYLAVPSASDYKILLEVQDNPKEYCVALFNLLHGQESLIERFKAYLDYVEKAKLTNKWQFPTYMLFLMYPTEAMFIKPERVKLIIKEIELDLVYNTTPSPEFYEGFLSFCKDVLDLLKPYGASDIIDVQSFLWVWTEAIKPVSLTSLKEALKKFNRDEIQKDLKKAEEERRQFLEKFPIESWPQMTLEQYALGQENYKETYCYWIEYYSSNLGSLRGGAARKHIIYKHREKGWTWYLWDEKYENEYSAWEAVKSGFIEAFEKAKAGDWNSIDKIGSLQAGPALRLKTLYIYFPDHFIPINSFNHLQHFLKLLGCPESNERNYDVVRFNQAILSALRDIPEFEGWSNIEMMRFLYFWSDPRKLKRIVKIVPGEKAKYWSDCFNGNYICVGWDELGDLRKFESKDSFRARFTELYGEEYNNYQPQITRKANELWTLMDLEPGDIIIANKGISKILAVGEVIEPGYDWMEARPEYKHIVHVKWDTSYDQEIEPQKKWGTVTVADVPVDLYSKIIKFPERRKIPVDPLFLEIEQALESKGQVILYGPPGTGKTYMARRFSVWWLSQKLGEQNPEAVLIDKNAFEQAEQRLSTVQITRRIWWIVANPKEWSWDTLFKEGRVSYRRGRLQCNYPKVQPGDLVIGYQAHPDKRIMALAKISRGLHSISSGEQKIELEPFAKVEDGPYYDELTKDSIMANSEPLRFRMQGTLFSLNNEEAEHLLAILTEKNPALIDQLEIEEAVGNLTRLTFHASYSYEDFIEGFRPIDTGSGSLVLRLEDGIFKKVCREAQTNPGKPYLVFIDEINRSNVAKVLGELITLLEKDKRSLSITLPQSKETFTIPPNVYLLGTMNTADRSIKLLDSALRRRFAFIELMPDPGILTGHKVGNLALDEFLEELNRRIAAKEGREKQIGHSYLLEDGVPISDSVEFGRRFRQEILPLLQEYCYDDYPVLAEFIGEKLVDRESQVLDLERLGDPEQLLEALEEEFSKSESGL